MFDNKLTTLLPSDATFIAPFYDPDNPYCAYHDSKIFIDWARTHSRSGLNGFTKDDKYPDLHSQSLDNFDKPHYADVVVRSMINGIYQ